MSTLHALERFNIALQIERRIVSTADPQFPSLTVSGNLPRLVVHVNEQKVEIICLMYKLLSELFGDISSGKTPVDGHLNGDEPDSPKKSGNGDKATMNHVMLFQFIIDRVTLELQSRGRSVAELQVTGVKASLSKGPSDLSACLSVHGLLLVDALQEFGPDFELLVASHKHIGMDSVSGSLRDSEPTSPVSPLSPGSPDPTIPRKVTSPISITHALSSLSQTPKSLISLRNRSFIGFQQSNSEALIVIDLLLVDDCGEKLRVANIKFNNLDIIANQETIVELVGFVRRFYPSKKSHLKRITKLDAGSTSQTESKALTRTEITFDFHRLNVLFLRAVLQDKSYVGQKIATATMSDARIQATLAVNNSASGSLGGLQILDQTATGKTHQRILSVGRDPLAEPQEHAVEQSIQTEAFRYLLREFSILRQNTHLSVSYSFYI